MMVIDFNASLLRNNLRTYIETKETRQSISLHLSGYQL